MSSSLAGTIGQDLLNVPMGDMIRQMAFAIAEAQVRLDENSIEVAEMMGGLRTIYDDEGNVAFEDSRVFFGRERIPLATAANIASSSNDEELKAAVAKELDENHSANVTKTGSGDTATYALTDPNVNPTISIPTRLSMLELGFTPTFYQFVDTIIEVRISISYTEERSSEVSVKSDSKTVSRTASLSWNRGLRVSRSRTVTTTQVNASYANKYNYSAEGSSLLRTKLAPVPPPAILEERIRQQMEILNQEES